MGLTRLDGWLVQADAEPTGPGEGIMRICKSCDMDVEEKYVESHLVGKKCVLLCYLARVAFARTKRSRVSLGAKGRVVC